MNAFNCLLAIIIIAVVIMGIVSSSKKRALFDQLQHLLSLERFDDFFELIDSKQAELVFPEYNRQYFKLNAYLMQGDTEQANQMLEHLLSLKSSKAQRRDLVLKAFNIYMAQENAERGQAMLHEIEGWDEPQYEQIKIDSRRLFDISMHDSTAYIEDMERERTSADAARKSQLDLMLAMQYGTLGNHEKRDEYLSLADKDAQEMTSK